MQSQLVIEPSYLNNNQDKTPYKQFSYNDTESFRESSNRLWEQVYQYPNDTSFFKRPKNEQKQMDLENTRQKSIPSAKEAWSAYDPEKQQMNLFEIFKGEQSKQQEPERIMTEEEPQKRVKRGWGDLFQQPFWGSSYQKPPPFMGAFDHVQPDFGTSLNVSVPTVSDYNPYSQYMYASKEDYPNPYNQNEKILDNLNDSKQKDYKYYFQVQSVQSQEEELQNLKESIIEHKEEPMDRSIAWSYDVLFGQRSEFKYTCPAWQTPEDKPFESNTNSKVFQVYKQHNEQLLSVMQSQVNLSTDIAVVLPDDFILKQLSKIMQNVECQLFTLDYDSLTWKLDLLTFRPQYFLRNSLVLVLKEALTVASYRSRLSAALTFLRANKYRKVYSQLSAQIADFLVLFEQIVLDMSNDCTLVEFLQQISKLSPEITILYNLLINQDYIRQEEKIYDNIDFRFLHSQTLIFKRITKLARNADSIELQNNSLVIKLLQAAFKPLLVLLQKLIFEQNQYLQLNTDLYLRYYFPNPKDLLQSTSRKLFMIKEQSNELYLICKIKERLQLTHQLLQLQKYQKIWQKSFKHKHKLINRIRKQHRQKIKWQRQRKRQQKMKQIYELKSKIYMQEQEESIMREQVKRKRQKQLNKLKKEIQEKSEKRRLMEDIEKEMQKNLLLDIQLAEKEKLAREKTKLIEIMKIEQIIVKEDELRQAAPEIKETDIKDVMVEEQVKNPSELQIDSEVIIPEQQTQKLNNEPQPIEPEQRNKQPQLQLKQESLIDEVPSQPLNIDSKIVPSQQGPASENAIISKQSIQSLQQRYMETADAFMVRQKSNFRNKTSSYFRLVNKPTINKSISSLQQDSDGDISSQKSAQSEEIQMEVEEEENPQSLLHRHTDLQTCLSICIDQVVTKQAEVIQHCLQFIILDKYEIMSVIQFLRLAFMSGDGQNFQQFIRLAVGQGSMISLRHFSECLLFDTQLENIQRLKPAFYHTKTNVRQNQINMFEDNVDHYIGFEFQALPAILQPFFSYIHLSKYMQIFSFVLRLRHCQNLVSESWKMLNGYKKLLDKQKRQHKSVEYEIDFMGKLCLIRYKISCFLKTFENYFFWRVIEKQYKNIRPKLKDLNSLEENHLKMLDNIIKYGLIDNPNHNISKSFKKILNEINTFYNIVSRLTLDDIPSYAWQQTQQKVQIINKIFDKQLKDIEILLFRSG